MHGKHRRLKAMLLLPLALPHRFARNLQAAVPHGALAFCSTARLLWRLLSTLSNEVKRITTAMPTCCFLCPADPSPRA